MERTKFGLLGYWSTENNNLGDYVQALAARQFLPSVDAYCEREELSQYSGEEIRVIMNGWYMHNPENFPPSSRIDPLLVSMHINSKVYKEMTSPKSIEYLNKFGPVGCRDTATEHLLKEKGVDAYFSGCLTLTLGRSFKKSKVTDTTLVVDPFYNLYNYQLLKRYPRRIKTMIKEGRVNELNLRKRIFKRYFEDHLFANVEYLTQDLTVANLQDGFKLAEAFLAKLASAKLVITSRIHCALPCLAIGTPVIFLNGHTPFDDFEYTSRFPGLLDFLNVIDVRSKKPDLLNFELTDKIGNENIPANKLSHLPYAKRLVKVCEDFISLP